MKKRIFTNKLASETTLRSHELVYKMRMHGKAALNHKIITAATIDQLNSFKLLPWLLGLQHVLI